MRLSLNGRQPLPGTHQGGFCVTVCGNRLRTAGWPSLFIVPSMLHLPFHTARQSGPTVRPGPCRPCRRECIVRILPLPAATREKAKGLFHLVRALHPVQFQHGVELPVRPDTGDVASEVDTVQRAHLRTADAQFTECGFHTARLSRRTAEQPGIILVETGQVDEKLAHRCRLGDDTTQEVPVAPKMWPCRVTHHVFSFGHNLLYEEEIFTRPKNGSFGMIYAYFNHF